MTTVKVSIPDRFLDQIVKCGREVDEVVIEALNKYFDPTYSCMDLERWKSHMEKKITDLQHQLDDHRSNCSSDVVKDFDKDLWSRKSGDQSPMALDTPYSPPKNNGGRSLVSEVNKAKAPVAVVSVDLPL